MQALRIFDELGQLDHPGADKIRAKLQPPGAQAAGRQPDPAADPDAPVGTAS